MVSIYDLLKEEKQKIEKLNSLYGKAVEAKQNKVKNEGGIWFNTDFKKIGATSEKLKSAYVKQQMAIMFPPVYENIKSEIKSLENDVKYLRQVIDVMKQFGVEEIDFGEKDKDKNGSS